MDTVPTHGDKPKKPLKVLIPFDATREQIEKAVEQILGPDPEKPKPVMTLFPADATDEELKAIVNMLNSQVDPAKPQQR